MIYGNYYIRHHISRSGEMFNVVSENNDDEMLVFNVPLLKLAEEIRDLINSWRRDITVSPSPPPEKL